MKKTKIAINGFGRIGRAFFREAYNMEDVEIVAINDLADIENLTYLLKFDTVYGRAPFEVEANAKDSKLQIEEELEIPVYSEKSPENLPWGDLGVDVVLESTGAFTTYEESQAHLKAGARKVVISAPVKDTPMGDVKGATVLMGINGEVLSECDISSNASCTTNAIGPLVSILNEKLGVEKALLNTVHGYTASQNIVDSPNEKVRRGRAGAQNIVPSSTGAAEATTKVITSLDKKFDGIALRVPVVAGSIADVTFISSRETTKEEVNEILKEAENEEKWQGIFKTTEEPIVSSDILGDRHGSIADLSFTRVVGGNLVKVLGWYDNEMGYTHTLLKNILKIAD